MGASNYLKQQFKILGWIILGWFLYSLYIQLMNQFYLGHFKNYVDFTAESIGFDYRKELFTTAFVSVIGAAIFGSIELFILKKRFNSYPIGKKLLYKIFIHALIILGLIWLGSMFYNTLRFQASPFSTQVLMGIKDFTTSTGFIGNFMFIYMGVLLTLVLLTINEVLGPGRLMELMSGKYNKALKEQRIFMFLDIKSSTTIAEQLGHELYFQMLNKFFADITEPILQSGGIIYQYVGDEIVLTWPIANPENNQQFIQAFIRMQQVINKEADLYQKRFGIVPVFKAGAHCGEVTTGAVGLIKKEIIHTGDPLNTTARIEKKCNELNQLLIFSEDLHAQLPKKPNQEFIDLGLHDLRGKEKPKRLFTVKLELDELINHGKLNAFFT